MKLTNWYEIKKYSDDIYIIKEPFHFEKTNIYYILGEKRNVLIDSGTGIYPLKELLITLDDKPIDLITSHVHWDHIGNHHEFENIFVHKDDSLWLEKGIPIPENIIKKELIKDVKKDYLPDNFNIDEYKMFRTSDYNTISEGDFFDLGNRQLKVLHTPGHSPGHICLYDIKKKILFSGDIIYQGCIYCNYPSTDPNQLYESVSKLSELKINSILAGHFESPISNKELRYLKEILNEVKNDFGLNHGHGKFTNRSISLLL